MGDQDESTSLLPSKLVSEIGLPSVNSPRCLDQALPTDKTERLDDGTTIYELWVRLTLLTYVAFVCRHECDKK